MKKHSFIQVDFHSTVKLTPRDLTQILKWLEMASLVMEKLILKRGLIHQAWLNEAQGLRVSVLLCGESRIRKLNLDHRSKDKVTDVLSFPSYESLRKPRAKQDFVEPVIFLGDLAICHQRAIQQAKDFDITYLDEFIHLFMHGLIHLTGYDHEISKKEERVMEEWETEALKLFSQIKKQTKRKGA